MDGERWERVARKVDLERVEHVGFAWHRFPGSCLIALREVQDQSSFGTRVAARVVVTSLAAWVFVARPVVDPSAAPMLARLAGRAELVLLTKGQPWVQRRRIRQSGLRSYFSRCVIVQDKTAEVFETIARSDGPHTTLISVGNSFASDLEPAVRTGYRGVLVDGEMWAYERRVLPAQSPQLMRSPRLGDVERLITQLACGRTSQLGPATLSV